MVIEPLHLTCSTCGKQQSFEGDDRYFLADKARWWRIIENGVLGHYCPDCVVTDEPKEAS